MRLRAAPEHREALTLLASILGEADLAKFSERAFRPDTAQSRFREAGTFLDRTRPPLTVEPDSVNGTGKERALPPGGRSGAAGTSRALEAR